MALYIIQANTPGEARDECVEFLRSRARTNLDRIRTATKRDQDRFTAFATLLNDVADTLAGAEIRRKSPRILHVVEAKGEGQ